MSQCPNCSYELVLLSSRQKYKCSLCNKLYPKKQIDNKEFRENNKRQRLLDIEKYNQEKKQELVRLRQLKRSIRLLFTSRKDLKEYFKKYYLKNKARKNQLSKDYYEKNKERLNLKIKLRIKNNPKLYNNMRKQWRTDNSEIVRIYDLIKYYRRKQKTLALSYLKNKQYKACTINIFHSVPTYSLSYLLKNKCYLRCLRYLFNKTLFPL